MDKILALSDVTERVNSMSKNCVDHYIPVNEITFKSLDELYIGDHIHPIKPLAQGSISNRLGIPFQYLKKCPEDIQALNLNHWIRQEKNEQLFFRFDGLEVRAVFTPRYVPVDNYEVIERLDSMGFAPDTNVQCIMDEEMMVISIPNWDRTFDVNGDKFRPGITISNSEVGLSSLSIAAFVLRLVCTNGMISKTDVSASYRHVSSKILTEFPEIMDKVSQELYKQETQMKFSAQSPVTDPGNTIQSFNRQFQLKKPEVEAVEWAWPFEAGEMMSNIVNTYTRASKYDGLPAESSYRLQKVGGNILAMLG